MTNENPKNTRNADMSGMTTNERLFVSGLLEDFDAAISRRDFAEVRSILNSVDVDDASIEKILDRMLKSSN